MPVSIFICFMVARILVSRQVKRPEISWMNWQFSYLLLCLDRLQAPMMVALGASKPISPHTTTMHRWKNPVIPHRNLWPFEMLFFNICRIQMWPCQHRYLRWLCPIFAWRRRSHCCQILAARRSAPHLYPHGNHSPSRRWINSPASSYTRRRFHASARTQAI